MGLTETRLAIIPGAGGTQRLPRLIGKGKAKELIFTGRRVDAEGSASIGLVNNGSAPGRTAGRLPGKWRDDLRNRPHRHRAGQIRHQLRYETDLQTGLAIESNAYWVTIPTEDRLEGLAAFREKRKPNTRV
jgi:enoyl-CoA hydratase/carnithine racemase